MTMSKPGGVRGIAALLMGMALVVGACGGDDAAGDDSGTTESPLADLQVIGVDFELDSIVLTNNGTETVRTEGLWVYQDGEASQFDINVVEPRATIQFGVSEVGGVKGSGGEIALFDSNTFSDAGSILDYVAWGRSGHDRIDVAVAAGLWAEGETVETDGQSVLLARVDPTAGGAVAWEATTAG